jgi:hypothetical protein
MAASVEQFFQGYVEALNRSLGEPVDLEAVRAHLAYCFLSASPGGLRCGNNDEVTEALRQMLDLYRAIGTKAFAIRGISTTPIDETHLMMKVDYRTNVEKRNGETLDLNTSLTYFLAELDATWKIFAVVTPDEMALAREHGLIEGVA